MIMIRNAHFRRLEELYAGTHNNQRVSIAHGRAQLNGALQAASTSDHHELLEDVAMLAAGSLEKERRVTAERFTVDLQAPDHDGPVTATARVVMTQPPHVVVEAALLTTDGAVIATARGVYKPGTETLPDDVELPEEPVDDNERPDPALFMPVFPTPVGMICLN